MQFQKWQTLDIRKGRAATLDLGNVLFTEDINPLKLGVKLYDGDTPVAVSGTVTGCCVLADGSTVTLTDTGSEDNTAWGIIPQLALSVQGRIEVFLRIANVETDSAVSLYAYGFVKRTRTDTVYIPGNPIPSVDAFAQIAQDCIDATAAAENYVRIVLPPLTRHIFPGVNENLSVASGSNIRTASIIYNTIYSEGHDRTGSTYQNVVMSVETPFRTTQPSNSNCVFQVGWFRTFTPITDTNYKMVVTLDGMTTTTGATTNPPLICVATYDPETYRVAWNDHPSYNSQTGVWASIPGVSLGVYGYRRRRFVISECLANGNMCVMVIFRRPTQEIDWTISVDVVNATYETWVEDLPVETMDSSREHWEKYIEGHEPEAANSLLNAPLNVSLNAPLGADADLDNEPEEEPEEI